MSVSIFFDLSLRHNNARESFDLPQGRTLSHDNIDMPYGNSEKRNKKGDSVDLESGLYY